MTDHDDASAEGDERFFEKPQRAEIEVVRRLVEHQNIAAALQDLGQQHAAPFSAAQLRDAGVDSIFAEQKTPQITAQRDAFVPEFHGLAAIAHLLPDGLFLIEQHAILIDVIDLRARTDFDLAARRLQLSQH